MINKNISPGSLRRLTAALLLITIVMFPGGIASEGKTAKKKLYISTINADRVSASLAKETRERIEFTVYEQFADNYHVITDEDVKIMFQKAEKLMATSCNSESCQMQIADAVDADEIIYGTISKAGKLLRFTGKTLLRNRDTFTVSKKSIVNITFSESNLYFHISEATKKLVNPSYRILSVLPADLDAKIDLKNIKIKKIKGLDIAVLRFNTNDDTLRNILAVAKNLLREADDYYKEEDYLTAKSEYKKIIFRIESRLSKDKQKKLATFVKGLEERAKSAYAMHYKKEIGKVDSKLIKSKAGGKKFLKSICEEYEVIHYKLSGRSYLKCEYCKESFAIALIKQVKERINKVHIAIAVIDEKKGDSFFRNYKFKKSALHYNMAKKKCNDITDKQKKEKYIKKYFHKIEAANRTGMNYFSNKAQSHLNRIEFLNIQDKTAEAKSELMKANKIIKNSGFASSAVIWQYMKIAKVVEGVPHMVEKNIGGITFVLIPGGEFIMSKSGYIKEIKKYSQKKVKTKVKTFWMGKFEVTQKQYLSAMKKLPKRVEGKFGIGDNIPVYFTTWKEADEFCDRINKKYGAEIRLPYESEWEYACRAGTTSKYYWGDKMDNKYLWHHYNAGRDKYSRKKPYHPVGKKLPNAFGLYDILGNVAEWCNNYIEDDEKNPQYYQRIARGGGIHSSPDYQAADHCTSSSSFFHQRGWSYNEGGFRVMAEYR